MKSLQASSTGIRLAIGCWVWRHGWGIVLLLILLLAASAGLAFKRHLLLQFQTTSIELDALNVRLTNALSAPPMLVPASPDLTSQQALLAATYPANEANSIVRRLHALSREHQVVIAESDYRMNAQGFGGLQQQQLTLPLQGRYPAVKAFVMKLLKEYPGLSVDQVMLRREDVSMDKPEVTVKVSLWLRPAASAPLPGPLSVAR